MGILLLTKSIFSMMIGLLFAAGLGLFLVPFLRRKKVGQNISTYVGESHKKKEGTPTFGGLIFIVPPLIIELLIVFFFVKFKPSFVYDRLILNYNNKKFHLFTFSPKRVMVFSILLFF